MNCLLLVLAISLSLSLWSESAIAGDASRDPWPGTSHSPILQSVLDTAVEQTLQRFAIQQLHRDQLAVTLVDLAHPAHPVSASHRGGELIYPASVVKLFYLVAVQRWLEQGRLTDTAELRRAMQDMIVRSYNDPTHYLVDLLTDTTSGPELSETELGLWQDRRNAINRYFAGLGYPGINLNKKPWCEGPYGREMQANQRFQPNRNLLTTDATARLLTAIFCDQILSPDRCAEIRQLLRRDLTVPGNEAEDQAQFTGAGLPPGCVLWSKAGWTSHTRHDAACVQLTNGRKIILVAFTVDHAQEREIIPTIARAVLAGLP